MQGRAKSNSPLRGDAETRGPFNAQILRQSHPRRSDEYGVTGK
jgi:hypothetical protein